MLRASTLVIAAFAIPLVAAAQTPREQTTEEHHHPHHRHPAARAHRHVIHHVRPPPHRTVAPPPPVVPVVKPAPPPPPPVGSVTGLPLPRFASFRSDEVNMRSGPGTRYPIQWVYKRRDLPVEIEREFDVWRLVETADGTKGWVHQATLIGDRTFVVLPAAPSATGGDLATAQTVRATPAENGSPAAYLKPGVIGHLVSCAAGSDWCRVDVHGVSGFLQRKAMWGLLPDEPVSPH